MKEQSIAVDSSSAPYVVAVSGGVDSMVLLDMLAGRLPKESLIVAHVDHGIREDSGADAKLVAETADRYGVRFETTELTLGFGASEERARNARYEWLRSVVKKHGAKAIVTAHHQDDLIETVILNVLRGTRWRGLASLRSTPEIRRPLLSVSKAEIIQYALTHGMEWRDDSTNQDVRLARNYVRHHFIPYFSQEERRQVIALAESQVRLRDEIEKETGRLVENVADSDGFPRYWMIMTDRTIGHELMQAWLGRTLQLETLDRLRHFAATAYPGASCDVEKRLTVLATSSSLVAKGRSI